MAMLARACLIVVALFGFSLGAVCTAHAQTAPAAAAPGAVPTPSCEKPGEAPRLLTSEVGREVAERKRNDWTHKMKEYVDCLKRFIDEEQAIAQSHIKAVNAAVEEYNKAAKAYNDQAQAR